MVTFTIGLGKIETLAIIAWGRFHALTAISFLGFDLFELFGF
jgi:hypothetical protein